MSRVTCAMTTKSSRRTVVVTLSTSRLLVIATIVANWIRDSSVLNPQTSAKSLCSTVMACMVTFVTNRQRTPMTMRTLSVATTFQAEEEKIESPIHVLRAVRVRRMTLERIHPPAALPLTTQQLDRPFPVRWVKSAVFRRQEVVLVPSFVAWTSATGQAQNIPLLILPQLQLLQPLTLLPTKRKILFSFVPLAKIMERSVQSIMTREALAFVATMLVAAAKDTKTQHAFHATNAIKLVVGEQQATTPWWAHLRLDVKEKAFIAVLVRTRRATFVYWMVVLRTSSM